MNETHRCPAWKCQVADVEDSKLMCLVHWRMVPGPLQSAVWSALHTHGLHSPALNAAQRAAIAAVNTRLGKPEPAVGV